MKVQYIQSVVLFIKTSVFKYLYKARIGNFSYSKSTILKTYNLAISFIFSYDKSAIFTQGFTDSNNFYNLRFTDFLYFLQQVNNFFNLPFPDFSPKASQQFFQPTIYRFLSQDKSTIFSTYHLPISLLR